MQNLVFLYPLWHPVKQEPLVLLHTLVKHLPHSLEQPLPHLPSGHSAHKKQNLKWFRLENTIIYPNYRWQSNSYCYTDANPREHKKRKCQFFKASCLHCHWNNSVISVLSSFSIGTSFEPRNDKPSIWLFKINIFFRFLKIKIRLSRCKRLWPLLQN